MWKIEENHGYIKPETLQQWIFVIGFDVDHNLIREKLAFFRIKELKDVLTQLGISKQGKKQDLVDRILARLSDDQVSKMWTKKIAVGKDQVAKLVDDVYRKMQVSGATDLASKEPGLSDDSNVKIKGEIEDPFLPDVKVRCLCGSVLETDSMIKCEDQRCNVWQHIDCVIIPEKPTEGHPPFPDIFYCEICRLNRADPFLVSMGHPLYPVKLVTTNVPTDGSNPVQTVEKTFQITKADKDLLSRQEYDVQAWCMLIHDKVPFRMQWPQYADLQVNGMTVRAINRPGSQLLGANGRDDGPIITPFTKDGINKIYLSGCDARIFCLGVRIVKRHTVNQILGVIPKESDGEHFEDALARVRRCIGGGTTTDNADSDSDVEVVADFFGVNLRCPMSGSRMKVAGRFKPCAHMGCFDLEVFVEMNQRSRKWQCPICLKNYALENIIIDPYFNRITSLMRHCGEDVTEVEVKPDGTWRVKAKTERERRDLGDLSLWHLPNGAIWAPNEVELKPSMEVLKQIKQEGLSDGYTGLKLEIRKNSNGFWEVSKPEDFNNSVRPPEHFGGREQKIIPMSCSATGSGRDGDDPSVNQDGGTIFYFSTNNGVEMDSLSLNIDPAYGFTNPNPSRTIDEVIVLSDSEEENDMLVSSGSVHQNNRVDDVGIPFSTPPGTTNACPEDSTFITAGLGLFNNNDDEYSLWPLPTGTQAGAGFQLFGSDAEVSDALVNLQHGSMNCSSSMDGYTMAPEATLGHSSLVPDLFVGMTDADMNCGLIDNTLVFTGNDPSLQIFLPTRPSDAQNHIDFREQADVSNGDHNEDWISLRLGGDACASNGEAVAQREVNINHHAPPRGAMDSRTDTASLLLGSNNVRSDKTIRPRSGSPFSFPRQKRSVRQRLYLSIDSDSE